jgi:hypothetical protein
MRMCSYVRERVACVRVSASERASERACVRACVRACACVCVRVACIEDRACVWAYMRI